jgi:hypothetical protein
MVSIHIVTDPKGADVLIAGQKIGTTPLDTKLKRGTKVQQLTVHLAGYQDVTSKIDLGGDYSNDHLKLVPMGETADGSASATVPAKAPAVDEHKPATSDEHKAVTDEHKPTDEHKTVKSTTHTTPPAADEHKSTKTTPHVTEEHKTAPAKPKCQPPGPNVDPFSPIPVCAK